jgi:hypothetical protein
VDKRKLAQGSIPAYVEAAANALFSVVMDADRLKDIKAAASAAGPDLVSVVDLLKSENTQVAANMTGKAGSISVALDAAIAFMKSTGALTQVKDPVQVVDPVTHKKVDRYHLERTNDYRVLLDVIEARGIVQSIDSLGLPAGTPPPDAAAAHAPAPGAPSAAGTAKPSKGVVTCKSSTPRAAGAPAKTASTEGTDAEADTDGDADIDSDDSLAKHINSTLDALVAANNAIADATPGCLKAAVSDLAARAQAVQSIASAIKK